MKRLIVNADDFGFTKDVNAGIVHTHVNGILTSTTLMATGDAFGHAVQLARETPTLDIGCHLVLVQGRSLISGANFPERPRDLLTVLLRNQMNVYAELRAQIQKIVDAGIQPTHLDSHKHTHIVPKVFRTVIRLAEEFGIPYVRLPVDFTLQLPAWSIRAARRIYLRFTAGHSVKTTDHFLGFRLTGNLDEALLLKALGALPDGTTELMCHPGFLQEELKGAQTRLKTSRVSELTALTSPRVRDWLNESEVRLSPFSAAVRP